MNRQRSVVLLAAMAIIGAALAMLVPSMHSWGTLVATICAVLAGLSALRLINVRLSKMDRHIAHVSRSIEPSLLSELHSMHVLLKRFPQCTLPTSGFSMRFSNLHVLLDILDQVRPTTVVEFGSGLSTLVVSAWLKEQGRGRLFSFDHDAEWASLTSRYLGRHSLEKYAEVFVAPLAAGRTVLPWYAAEGRLSDIHSIDLVIVDGPPAGSALQRTARAPALPALHQRLSAAAVVVLDDANREGETEVIERWLREFPEFECRRAGGATGLAILERRDSSSGVVDVGDVIAKQSSVAGC